MPAPPNMSQKRKRTDQPEGERNAQAKKPFRPGQGPHKYQQRRTDQAPRERNGASISELKSRIRNLRRLLEHVESAEKHKMPAGVRIERERELAACQHELLEKSSAVQEAERRRNLISKYHHVRFFDRQKATRILKKLRRRLPTETEAAEASEDQANLAELKKDIHDAEVAVNYSIYYPLMKPYFALYPRTKEEKGNDEDVEMKEAEGQQKLPKAKGDPDMWAAVERAMEEGTLDELRNRDEGVASRRAKSDDTIKQKQETKDKKRSRPKPTLQTTTARRTADDGDESDGGFFE